jgi:hypothetical protein
MNRRYLRFSAFLAVITTLVLAGCTAPKFSPVTHVPSDKALVYIYRKANLWGIGGNHHIFVDGQPITSLYSGSYYPYFANPGTNRFSSKIISPLILLDVAMNETFKGELVQLNAEPGRTYYLQFNIATSWGPKITRVNAEKGAREIVKCHLAKPLK